MYIPCITSPFTRSYPLPFASFFISDMILAITDIASVVEVVRFRYPLEFYGHIDSSRQTGHCQYFNLDLEKVPQTLLLIFDMSQCLTQLCNKCEYASSSIKYQALKYFDIFFDDKCLII